MTAVRPGRVTAGLLALLLAAAAGCSTSSTTERSGTRAGRARVVTKVVRAAAAAAQTLPSGYDPIEALVGDQAGTGVWFWDQTKTQDTIFLATPGGLKSWPVYTGDNPGVTSQAGFAVGPGGRAWLGVGRALYELDPATGHVTTWTIPSPQDNPAAEAFQPAALQDNYAVRSLAVSSTGVVALAMTSSSSVVQLDPSTGTFTQIVMPTTSDEPLAVAYSSSTGLDVGMSDIATGGTADELLIDADSPSPAHVVTLSRPGSAYVLTPLPSGALAVGSSAPELIGAGLTPSSIDAASTFEGSDTFLTATAAGPSGTLVGVTSSGAIGEASIATASTTTQDTAEVINLPLIACQPNDPSFAGTGTSGNTVPPQPPPGSMCSQPAPEALGVDGDGTIWYVSPDSNTTVQSLQP